MSNVVLSRTIRIARSRKQGTVDVGKEPEFDTTNKAIGVPIGQNIDYNINATRQRLNRLSGSGVIEGFVRVSQDSSFGLTMNFIENAHDFLIESALNTTFKMGFMELKANANESILTKHTYTGLIRPDSGGSGAELHGDPRRLDIDISTNDSDVVGKFLRNDNIIVGTILLIHVTNISASATPDTDIPLNDNGLSLLKERRYVVKAINKTDDPDGTPDGENYVPPNTLVLSLMDEVVVANSATGDLARVEPGLDIQIGTKDGQGLRTIIAGDASLDANANNKLSATDYRFTSGYIAYKYIRHANNLQYYHFLISLGNVGDDVEKNTLLSTNENVSHTAIANCVASQTSINFNAQSLITLESTFTGTNVFERVPAQTDTASKPFVDSDSYQESTDDEANVKATGTGGFRVYIDGTASSTPVVGSLVLNLQRELASEPTNGQLTPGYLGSGNLVPEIRFRGVLESKDRARELATKDTYHNFTYMQGYVSTQTTSGTTTGYRLETGGDVRPGLTSKRLFHISIPKGSYQINSYGIEENLPVSVDVVITAVGIKQTASSTTQDTQPRFTENVRQAIQINMI